jgi:branched-chain amino acid transport system ATP-binding protein
MDDVVIQTIGLTKQFQGFTAVDSVDLCVRTGRIHALIGPNGAGKTTLFNLITKFLAPTAGKILFKGEDVTEALPADLAVKGMVRSFQISAIFPYLTVRQNIQIALQRKLRNSYSFWRPERDLDVLNERTEDLLKIFDLSGVGDVIAAGLPYGRKRAMELATTFALDPEVLLLDEPMAGMTQHDVQRTAELIQRIAANRTVLMVEHNLSVVAEIADTITVLVRGRILAEGDYETISRNPEVITAYMGTAHA